VSEITRNLKPYFESLTAPLVDFLKELKIKPDYLSYLGVLLTLFSVPFLWEGNFLIGGILATLGSLMDALDGHLARRSKSTSPFGALLDSTLDRISDFLILFGLALHFAEKSIWLIITLLNMLFWFLVSYVKARLEGLGVKKVGGWFERPERLIVLLIFIFLNKVEIGLIITLIGAFITFLQRMFIGYKALKLN
jgi:phosphatidylglycerophosphate synthase